MPPKCQMRSNPTVESHEVLSVPGETIMEALRSLRVVKGVERYTTSDYLHADVFKVKIPSNCSHNIHHELRKLGIYIETVDNLGDEEVLNCRRIVDLLDRMEKRGANDQYRTE